MPEASLTPEEKLLRMIESPKGAMPSSRPMDSGRRNLQDLKLSWKFIFEKYFKLVKEGYQDYLNLRTANIIFLSLSVAATIYVGFDFPLGNPRSNILTQIQSAARRFDIGNLSLDELAPVSIFTQEITQRNIFSLPESAPKPSVAAATSAAASGSDAKLKEATTTLKLVGIIWSSVPQAIIEDTRDSRTHLLNRGGKIKDARVKDILKDRVILSYDGQEIELR